MDAVNLVRMDVEIGSLRVHVANFLSAHRELIDNVVAEKFEQVRSSNWLQTTIAEQVEREIHSQVEECIRAEVRNLMAEDLRILIRDRVKTELGAYCMYRWKP